MYSELIEALETRAVFLEKLETFQEKVVATIQKQEGELKRKHAAVEAVFGDRTAIQHFPFLDEDVIDPQLMLMNLKLVRVTSKWVNWEELDYIGSVHLAEFSYLFSSDRSEDVEALLRPLHDVGFMETYNINEIFHIISLAWQSMCYRADPEQWLDENIRSRKWINKFAEYARNYEAVMEAAGIHSFDRSHKNYSNVVPFKIGH